MLILEAMFDFVSDNLINNVLNKRQREPEFKIHINLYVQPFLFSICDNGSNFLES